MSVSDFYKKMNFNLFLQYIILLIHLIYSSTLISLYLFPRVHWKKIHEPWKKVNAPWKKDFTLGKKVGFRQRYFWYILMKYLI